MDSSVFFMNLLKHHGLYLKSFIESWAATGSFPDKGVFSKIGGSQMDLYLGCLQPNEIFQELSLQLRQKKIYFRNDFIHWISPKDFQILSCSDGSRWILRLKREDPDTFVHLHPARHSPFSCRIKANTLKTTVLAAIFFKINHQLPDKTNLNKLRTEHLSLSPTQSISWDQKVLEFFL